MRKPEATAFDDLVSKVKPRHFCQILVISMESS